MKIVHPRAEVRLFVIGFAYAPMASGGGTKLEHESLPMWALMRTGEIRTSLGQEYILGIGQNSGVHPTFSKLIENLHPLARNDLFRTIKDQPVSVRRSCQKAMREPPTGHLLLTEITKSDNASGMEVLRMAILLPIHAVREIVFQTNQGFGVWLDKRQLEQIIRHDEMKGENKKIIRQVKIGRLKWQGIQVTLPCFITGPRKITIDLHGDKGDLIFARDSLKCFSKWSREERLKAWEKAMKIRFC